MVLTRHFSQRNVYNGLENVELLEDGGSKTVVTIQTKTDIEKKI
jgi:hypothetical protein